MREITTKSHDAMQKQLRHWGLGTSARRMMSGA
jgi:hypothetical protein